MSMDDIAEWDVSPSKIHKDMKFLLKESPYAFYDFNF